MLLFDAKAFSLPGFLALLCKSGGTLVGSVHPLRATPGSKHNSNVGTSCSSRHGEGTAKLVAHPRAENGCVVESKPLGSLQTILWPKVRVGNTNTLCAHTYILPNNALQWETSPLKMFKFFLFVTDVLVCQAQPANKLDLGAVERFHPTRSRGSVVVVVVVVFRIGLWRLTF